MQIIEMIIIQMKRMRSMKSLNIGPAVIGDEYKRIAEVSIIITAYGPEERELRTQDVITNDIEGGNGEGLGNVDTGGKNIRRMNSSLFRELMQHYKEA